MGLLSRVTAGTTLRRLRRERHLTQSVLASMANVSLGLIAKIELGECSCSLRALVAIVGALGMKPAEFVRQIEDLASS